MRVDYDFASATLTVREPLNSDQVKQALLDYKSASTLKVLDSIYLQHLPKDLHQVRRLVIKDCPKFETLADAGRVSDLVVSRCQAFDLSDCENQFTTVYFRDCPSLSSLESITKASVIEVECCHSLTTITSSSSRLNYLRVVNCESVSAIEVDGPVELNLIGLPALTSVPSYKETEELEVASCVALQTIGSYSSLTRLDLRDCPELEVRCRFALRDRRELDEIIIIGCPKYKVVVGKYSFISGVSE